MKKIYLVLLDQFADWEQSYVSLGIHNNLGDEYEVEYVSLHHGIIHSMGGLPVMIEQTLSDIKEPAAVVLIGGETWKSSNTTELRTFIDSLISNNIVIGSICGASEWLAANGLINNIKHTSNGVDSILAWPDNLYHGNQNYIDKQVVVDHNVVTANGTAALQFSKELQLLLAPDKEEMINLWFQFHHEGYIACMNMKY